MKRSLLFAILICIFALSSAIAQTKAKPRELRKLNDRAEEAFYDENYRKALSLYQELYRLNPDGADYYNYQIALCYLYSNIDNQKALTYIDMAEESMAETEVADFYYYNMAKSYHLNNKFDDAIMMYQKALDIGMQDKNLRNEIEWQMQVCKNAMEITKKPLEVKITNLGEPVNTQYADYRPVISADESILIFTSRRDGASNGNLYVDGRNYEDIYITEKDELGYWKQPEKISANINTDLHEASVGLSPDGRELIIYKGNPDAGGLFISRLVGTEWTVPQMLGENIDSKKYHETSASISADGKYIYFVSDRKGRIGERDIWKSEKTTSGEWGKAMNLGENINTPYDEESPFIHPDGKTLYFSSKGHNSIGGYDIFKSIYENGNWSKPENIGYPINTPGDDVHFVLSASGKDGYFTSSRTGTLGEQDIYKVAFDVSVPLILVKGIVKKEEPGPFNVSISVIDKQNNELEKNVYNPNSSTGKYLLILPPGKNYDMIVSAENYKAQVININIPEQKEFYEIYQEITLRKISKAGEVAQEVTVVNYFNDIRKAGKSDDSPVAEIGKTANADYVQSVMQKLVTTSAKQGANSEAAVAQIEKLNALTDKVTDNFDKVLESKIQTEAITSSYSPKKESTLQPVIVGNETIYAVPSSSFVAADVDKTIEEREKSAKDKELAQLKSDLAKAKNTPKSGNYIVDLANERYIENLEEEISAVEGGYAMNAKKEKKQDYAVEVKKQTGIYGTKTTEYSDKEKELADREAAVAKREAEQSELMRLRAELAEAKKTPPTGNKITDIANQKYIKNLEEQISAMEGGYAYEPKKETSKEKFAEVKKQSGIFGTETATEKTASSEKVEKKEQESTAAKSTQGDFSAKEKELAAREAAIAKKESELNTREKELQKREVALSVKDSEMAAMAAANAKKESAREKELQKREAELSVKDSEIAAMGAAMAKKESSNKKEAALPVATVGDGLIIYFEYNKSDVQSQYEGDLNNVFSQLKENAAYKLEISGHADSKGTDDYNSFLSKRRAENVAKYFLSKGIKRNRMAVKHFGETQPLAPNANPDGTDNPAGRDKNRRAEIKVKN